MDWEEGNKISVLQFLYIKNLKPNVLKCWVLNVGMEIYLIYFV
jgi:hypothetical protein